MSHWRSVEEFLHRKREKRRLARLKTKQPRQLEKHGRYTSYALRMMRKVRPTHTDSNKSTDEVRIGIPTTFSIIDDPERALDVFENLVSQNDRYRRIRKLFFDHSKLVAYDLASEQILDHLSDEIRKERDGQKPQLRHQGAFPTDERCARFIKGIGIIRKLGLDSRYLSDQEKDKLEIFDRSDSSAFRELKKASEKTTRDTAIEMFVEHFDKCLGHSGFELTAEGRQELGVVTGEVIDNAIEHSKGDGWVVAGYLDTSDDAFSCEIAIFNFGHSMAETLSDLPDDHFTTKQIAPYIDEHKTRGLFRRGWTEDDLRTLVALQENISSKNSSTLDTRGSGTIDLIEFFQGVYDECGSKCESMPKMAILSGSTHILFDGRYRLSPDSSGRNVIAFNESNTLEAPPDRSCITHLSDHFFPGTIVSIQYPLPEKQLRVTLDKSNE